MVHLSANHQPDKTSRALENSELSLTTFFIFHTYFGQRSRLLPKTRFLPLKQTGKIVPTPAHPHSGQLQTRLSSPVLLQEIYQNTTRNKLLEMSIKRGQRLHRRSIGCGDCATGLLRCQTGNQENRKLDRRCLLAPSPSAQPSALKCAGIDHRRYSVPVNECSLL